MKTRSYLSRGRQLGAWALFCSALGFLVPAHASDTEVYARSIGTTPGAAPVITFLLDNSGSMTDCVSYDSSSGTCSPASQQKINVLKTTMQCLLVGCATGDTSQMIPGNVKVGYSRYYDGGSNSDGQIVFPARALDNLVAIDPFGYLGTSASSDAEQVSSSSGVVTGNTTLSLGYTSSGTKQTVGMQFGGLNIPKGATVTAAFVTMVAGTQNSYNTGTPTWQVQIEDPNDSANSKDFTQATILSRSFLSGTQVYQPAVWTTGTSYTMDVTNLVNNAVNTSNWCGGQNITLRVDDISASTAMSRVAYSSEYNSGASAPTLTVYFSVDPSSTNSCALSAASQTVKTQTSLDDISWPENNLSSVTSTSSSLALGNVTKVNTTTYYRTQVGVRFTGISIPSGSTITSAALTFQSYQGNSISNAPTLQVGLLQPASTASAGSAKISGSGSVAFCSGCSAPPASWLSSTVTYPAAGGTWSWSSGSSSLPTVDVTSMVKSYLGTGGLTGALAFLIQNNSAASSSTVYAGAPAYAYDGSSSKSMQLTIQYMTPVTNLTTFQTVRQQMWTAINAVTASTDTPLGTTYAETARYMMGRQVYEASSSDTAKNAAKTYYVSPISGGACMANYILLLTDGIPNADSIVSTVSNNYLPTACSSGDSWGCMNKTAAYLLSGTNAQNAVVRTSTVGLGADAANLADLQTLANTGGGTYYPATSASQLGAALRDTINRLLEQSGTISAPGVAVNQLTRTSNLDQLYYAVFSPQVNVAYWGGNLKRYRLTTSGSIVDQNSNVAIDPLTTFFKNTSCSFWTPNCASNADGASATSGGAAAQLPPPANRIMYTFMGAYPSTPVSGSTTLTRVNLSNSTFNSAAMTQMGLTDSNVYKNLINWFLGYDITNAYNGLVDVTAIGNNNNMGGAFHSRPVVVNYGYNGSSASAAASNPALERNTVFVSTMSGVLHAIDASSGVEQFSFVPQEKLATIKTLYDNPSQSVPEMGLDSSWTVYRNDSNGDSLITVGADSVYIYGGMRMGGSTIYALDVTDMGSFNTVGAISTGTTACPGTAGSTSCVPSTAPNPKLLFTLQAGGTGPLQNMGQTWSQPVLGKMKINNVIKTVMVVGGGYDPQHETAGIRSSDSVGNQVYIVDAMTGQIYWWASNTGSATSATYTNNSNMSFAIPSAAKLVDTNNDGLFDEIYIGDLGGQVFRIDIDNRATATNPVKRVKLFASLGQTVSGAGLSSQHRFYEPATVAFFTDSSQRRFAMVGLGSGYRSHPLDTTTSDNFYGLYDYEIFRGDLLTMADTSLSATILPTTLQAVTVGSAVSNPYAGKSGIYLAFPDSGEKSMASGLIYNNTLTFTSYVPSVTGGSTCSPVVGRSKLYTIDLTGVGVTAVTDNVMLGIAGQPVIVVLPDSGSFVQNPDGSCSGTGCNKTSCCVGTNCSACTGPSYSPGLWRKRWYPYGK